MAIDAVKTGPAPQAPEGPKPPKAEKPCPECAKPPAGAPVMNPGQPEVDTFGPPKK